MGNVVGQVEDGATSEWRAAYWEISGSVGSIQSQLGPLTGGIRADGINDVGEIVGYGKDSNGQNLGLYWAHAAPAPLLLPPLNQNVYAKASAISNDGVVCGYCDGQAVACQLGRR